MMRILTRLQAEPWAMRREEMSVLLDIAQRKNDTPEAVAQKLGRPLDNTYAMEMRDGVAILPVSGPLFRYASWFTMVSGATSYDLLARDFAQAMADPNVKSILLNIDSPGGEVNGVAEFADQIFAARGSKKITAYVGGLGASAAYWIASAADEIVAADTAMIGSLGTVTQVSDTRERDAKAGIKTFTIVSSQSPYKRLDPSTDAGMAKMQGLVDSLSDVFIAKVARNRGVSVETVTQDYGQGDVFVGAAAVNAGMIDRLGSYESVISELQSGGGTVTGFNIAASRGSKQEKTMSNNTEKPKADAADVTPAPAATVATITPEAAEALRAEGREAGATAGRSEGASAERARIQAIIGSEQAAERSDFAAHLAYNTFMPAEEAIALLAAAPKNAKAEANGFANAMDKVQNPDIGADKGGDEGGDDAAFKALSATAQQLGKAPKK